MAPPPSSPAAPHSLGRTPVIRQPIFRADYEVYGYELFFGVDKPTERTETEAAPVAVIERAGREIQSLVGTHRAFINLTREVILSGCCDCLPSRQVVLEVLEDVPPDRDVITELSRLSRGGYKIALDDFVFEPTHVPFVDIADIVKIDVLATGDGALRELVHELRPFDVQLLAEKVETENALRLAESLEFDYFQGYFLGRPISKW